MKEVKTDLIIREALHLLVRREKDGMAVTFTASELYTRLRQMGHHPSILHMGEVLKANFAYEFIPSSAGVIAGHNVYFIPLKQENAQ